ncbi:MAG: hypothetical protein H6719_22190 [Sandaracinaceae bacterium]|nr:hypothetical protein [Sandaracinaceae bacterium]
MAKRVAAKACPCTSGAAYADCCAPFHRGAEATTADRLMRSRFAAFALGDGAYLWRTLHPTHPLRSRPEAEVVRELSRAKQTLRYQRLTVHDHDEDGDRARVLFTAHVFEKGKDRSFTELSEFARVDGAWRYREGLAVDAPAATIVELLERLS